MVTEQSAAFRSATFQLGTRSTGGGYHSVSEKKKHLHKCNIFRAYFENKFASGKIIIRTKTTFRSDFSKTRSAEKNECLHSFPRKFTIFCRSRCIGGSNFDFETYVQFLSYHQSIYLNFCSNNKISHFMN